MKVIDHHILKFIEILETAKAEGDDVLRAVIKKYNEARPGFKYNCAPFCILLNIFIDLEGIDHQTRRQMKTRVLDATVSFVKCRYDLRRSVSFPVINPTIGDSGFVTYTEIATREVPYDLQINMMWVRGAYAEDRWDFIQFTKNHILGLRGIQP